MKTLGNFILKIFELLKSDTQTKIARYIMGAGLILVGGFGNFIFTADVETAYCNTTPIICTANIASADHPLSTESNQSNNVSSVPTSIVPDTSTNLTINKTASISNLGTGGTVTYTVVVTNNGSQAETFSITDLMQGSQGGSAGGSNGGTMTLSGTNIVFSGGGSATGSISSQPFQITALEAGKTVTITYQGNGVNSGVPAGATSQFTNVATLSTGGSDSAIVHITGPSGGSSGGGGGHHGGGGSRTITRSANLKIKKDVWNGSSYIAADTAATAANFDQCGLTSYRIIISNTGDIAAKEVTISDSWDGSGATRGALQNVSGADYNPIAQTFLIDEIDHGKSATITYQTNVSCNGNATAKNTALIESAAPEYPSSRRTKTSVNGVGSSNPAHIKVGNTPTPPPSKKPGKIVLIKKAAKAVVKPGEEDSYSIIFRNRDNQALENVVLTDTFPFTYFDLLDSNTNYRIEGEIIEFNLGNVQPKATKVITIKVRAKSVSSSTVTRNTVVAKADNKDLSNLLGSAEIIISPQSKPPVIPKTGLPIIPLTMLLLGGSLAMMGRRVMRFG